MAKQKEFERVDEYYEEVLAMVKRLERVNEEFNKDEGIDPGEHYLGPFHQVYELEGTVRKIRDDLLGYVVRKLNKSRCPNVTVEIGPLREKLIERFGELGFSMKFISGYIGTHYVAHSEGMSQMEILTKAKHLLPVIWVQRGRKKLTVDDIVDGRKLVLHAYMDSTYGNTRDGVIALDKLIRITLDDVPAAKVVSYSLFHVFRLAPYSTHEMAGDHIEKMRAYKNCKLLIYFRTEEKARRVAEALLK